MSQTTTNFFEADPKRRFYPGQLVFAVASENLGRKRKIIHDVGIIEVCDANDATPGLLPKKTVIGLLHNMEKLAVRATSRQTGQLSHVVKVDLHVNERNETFYCFDTNIQYYISPVTEADLDRIKLRDEL